MTRDIAEIPEIHGVDAGHVFKRVAAEATPVVIRGLASGWPLVQKALESAADASDYLLGFYQDTPVTAFVSESDIGGRIFYTDELADTNFRQVKTTLGWVLDRIRQHADDPAPPTVYMGSAAIDHFLPGLGMAGFGDENWQEDNVTGAGIQRLDGGFIRAWIIIQIGKRYL